MKEKGMPGFIDFIYKYRVAMVISASQEAKRNNISVVRVHGSSAAALHSVLALHCAAI